MRRSFDIAAGTLPSIEVEQTICLRIAAVASAQPEHLAVDDGNIRLDYRSLLEWSNRIAAMLRSLNLDRSLPIAIGIAPGALQIASTLGVLAAGHFYLPLDGTASSERTRRNLADAEASHVLVDNETAAEFAHETPAGWQAINVETAASAAVHANTGDGDITPGSLAYVLYTSGSTGKPKGVMHNHANVLHNARRHAREYAIQTTDRQSLLYTPGVYGGQRDMYNALLNGASLHVYPLRSRGIAGLERWLASERITIYCSVTTVFRRLCAALDERLVLPELRLVKLGGEASYRTDVETFQRLFPRHCRLHCGLGSTETGLARSYFVDHSTMLPGDAVPLGYAVEDLDIELRNGEGGLVADGEIGEIVVCSRYIALGYWRDELATQRAFGAVPGDSSMRRYRTGDLGVLLPDARLEHRGRLDARLKIHGNRVDPVEIETAMLRLDEVQEAAVVVRRDAAGLDSLVAFLVGTSDMRPSNAALRGILAKRLPSHMVPSRYVWIDELPVLDNGKLDRAGLAVRNIGPVETESAIQAPRSVHEARLLDAWRKTLGVASAGIDDDFFALGGDSLKMMAMLTQLEAEFALDLLPSTFMTHATVRRLASLLQAETRPHRMPLLVPLRESGERAPLFCVHGIFGSALILRSLMPYLPLDRPLYELQSPHLDGSRFRFGSLRELSARYLREMLSVRPSGPYYLCGFSFGGLIALEMATQLRAAGHCVGYLGIIDGHPPAESPPRFGGALSDWRRLGLRTAAEQWREAFARQLVRSRSVLRDALCIVGWRVPQAARRGYLRSHHARLAHRHYAPRYVGDVDVFCTEARARILRRRWTSAVDGEVTFIPIPGEHATLHEWPHAPDFAARMAVRLAMRDDD